MEQQPALTPVKHVNDDDHVALARQRGRRANAGVVLPSERRQAQMLVRQLDQLFLAPQVKRAVVMEVDDRRRRKLRIFRDEHVSRHADIRGRVEIDFLPDVIAAVHAIDNLGARGALWRCVVEQFEQSAARATFPGGEPFELWPQERKRKLPLHRLTLNQRKQRAEFRACVARGRKLRRKPRGRCVPGEQC